MIDIHVPRSSLPGIASRSADGKTERNPDQLRVGLIAIVILPLACNRNCRPCLVGRPAPLCILLQHSSNNSATKPHGEPSLRQADEKVLIQPRLKRSLIGGQSIPLAAKHSSVSNHCLGPPHTSPVRSRFRTTEADQIAQIIMMQVQAL